LATIGEQRELYRSLRRATVLLVRADRSELAGRLAIEAGRLALRSSASSVYQSPFHS
jgi:hypothetical protein